MQPRVLLAALPALALMLLAVAYATLARGAGK